MTDMTVSELLERWHAATRDEIAPATRRHREWAISQLLVPHLGHLRVEELTTRRFAKFCEEIENPSPAKISAATKAMRQAIRWAVRFGRIPADPMQGITPVRMRSSERDRVLADHEIRSILDACIHLWSGTAVAHIVPLLFLTACRRQEIGGLRREEVHLRGEVGIHLPAERTKQGRPHIVPLTKTAVRIVRPWYEDTTEETPYLFGRSCEMEFKGWDYGHKMLELAMKRPIDRWTFHDIRRTVATGMQRIGVNIPVIEAVLGHASPYGSLARVYQRYGYYKEKRQALEAWEDYLVTEIAPEQMKEITRLA